MTSIKSNTIELVDIESIVKNPKKIPDTNYLIYPDGRLYNTKTKRFKKATPTKDGYLDLGLSCSEIAKKTNIQRRYINGVKLGRR